MKGWALGGPEAIGWTREGKGMTFDIDPLKRPTLNQRAECSPAGSS